MKNIKIGTLLTVFSVLAFTSCDQDESVDRAQKPILSVNKSYSIAEGEDFSDLDLNFKLNERVRTINNSNIGAEVGAEVQIRVVGGTATQGDDYEILLPTNFDTGFGFWGGDGYYLNIPGETLEFDFPLSNFITIFPDLEQEGNETIELLVSPSGVGQAEVSQKIVITINDTVPGNDDALRISLNWNERFNINGDNDQQNVAADMDLEIFLPGDPTPVLTSYTSMPEFIGLNPAAPDGLYIVLASLFTNGEITDDREIPAFIEFRKNDAYSKIDISETFNYASGGLNQGNNNSVIAFTIQKTGTNCVISNPFTMETVFSSKNNNEINNIIKNIFSNKSKNQRLQ